MSARTLGRAAPVAFSLSAIACAALVGLPDVPEPAAIGSNDAGDAEAEAPADPCARRAPPRPTADDPSSDPDQSFVVAMRAVDFGVRVDGGPRPLFGYDLDGVSTCCRDAPESCIPATGTRHCDEEGGIDNSASDLLSSLALVAPEFSQEGVNRRIAQGLYTILFQVQHYNGTPNDRSVTVGVLSSRGIESQSSPDASTPPAWDGNDAWTVDSDFILGSPDASPLVPGRFDARAYVSGGVLVASIDFPISLGVSGGNTVVVSLTGALVTAQVVDAGAGRYRLERGQIAGRYATRALLGELPNVYALGAFICPGTATHAQLESLICKAADVNADPARDRTGAACDALSLGFGFTSDPARAGRVVKPPKRPVNCPDAAVQECPGAP
jgi:hypothetical protein